MGLRPEALGCIVLHANALTVFRQTNTLQCSYPAGSRAPTPTP
jgi:hypothetical protein